MATTLAPPYQSASTTTGEKNSVVNYIPFDKRTTRLLGHDVKVKVTPANLVRDILNHNTHNQFTQILFVGGSGTGKTTVRQNLIHELHERYNYALHYYQKKEIQNIDKIIKSLPKGVDCILAFDDVSWTFQAMKPAEIAEVLHQLTFIRHTLGGARVIVMMSIHYSFGLLKGLRQAAFRVITSATDEETENYAKIFGSHNRRNIRNFVFQYRSMMLYNKFQMKGPAGEDWIFETDNPFRLALVSNLGKLHYMIYHKVDCGVCNVRDDKQHNLNDDDVDFWLKLAESYPVVHLIKMINLYVFVKSGEPVLELRDRQVWKRIAQYHERHNVSLEKIAKVLKESKKLPQAGKRQFIMESLRKISEDTEKEHRPEKIDDETLEKRPDDPTIQEPDEDDDTDDLFEKDDDDDELEIPGVSKEGGAMGGWMRDLFG